MPSVCPSGPYVPGLTLLSFSIKVVHGRVFIAKEHVQEGRQIWNELEKYTQIKM